VSTIVPPEKTHAELIVDADTMLTLAVPLKQLQAIRRGNTEIVESLCSLQLIQFRRATFAMLANRRLLRFSNSFEVSASLKLTIIRVSYDVLRHMSTVKAAEPNRFVTSSSHPVVKLVHPLPSLQGIPCSEDRIEAFA
jgi:hypothetical protein